MSIYLSVSIGPGKPHESDYYDRPPGDGIGIGIGTHGNYTSHEGYISTVYKVGQLESGNRSYFQSNARRRALGCGNSLTGDGKAGLPCI